MTNTTILLVEDQPTDEVLLIRAFHKGNIRNPVDVVRDGAEAIEYLLGADAGRETRPLPTLVLLDLRLPKIDGLDVLKRIRRDRRTAGLPVVVLTSSQDDEERARTYDTGANGYLRKPVDLDALIEAVRFLKVEWR